MLVWAAMISVSVITAWLLQYKYAVLFPVVVVEGPIVTILAGFLSSLGYMNLWIAYAIAVVGDLSGDCLYYVAGRFGRERFVMRYGRWFGITLEKVKKVENHFVQHGGKTLAVGKLLHGIGQAFLVAAGVVKMPFERFLWYNLLATVPKSLGLILVGYFFGHMISSINIYLTVASVVSISVAGIAVLVYVIYFRNEPTSIS